ncbi:MAG TPA: DUF4412 domain-containing protein [Candidatus Sulfotelmatobacter sp.]|nr:DUF4412 domain-containing protein [Candidatus Sulfotelmatobacter sp.]
MPRNPIAALLALLAASVLCMPAAHAGVVLTIANGGDAAGQQEQTKVYLEPGQVKIQTAGGGIIYHDGAKNFTTYSDSAKTYTETSPEQIKAVQAQALARLQQQMAKMPEAQRAQMQAALDKYGMAGSAAKPPAISYQKTAAGQTVGTWHCDQYDELADNKKVAEICIARLADLGLEEQDLAAFRGLSKAMANLGPRMVQERTARLDFDTMKAQIGFAGLPVRTVEISDGQPRHETVVKSVERVALPAATFQVPQGYSQRDLVLHQPGGRRGGGSSD